MNLGRVKKLLRVEPAAPGADAPVVSAERWPLDFEQVKRGDVIPWQVLEKILNCKRSDAVYGKRCMALASKIQLHFAAYRRDGVLVVVRNHNMHVLTHAEQVKEAQRQAAIGARKIAMALIAVQNVDTAELTREEREEHARTQHVLSFKAQQLRKRPPPALTDE